MSSSQKTFPTQMQDALDQIAQEQDQARRAAYHQEHVLMRMLYGEVPMITQNAQRFILEYWNVPSQTDDSE